MSHAAIALGSSLGDSHRTLALATDLLAATHGVYALHPSRVFLTAPAGGVARRPFLNAAVHVETTLGPHALLARCRDIERRLGRRPSRHWADRVIDLDILTYDLLTLNEPNLVLPHPRMHLRAFQLIPLLDCWPGVPGPWAGLARDMRAPPIVGVLRRPRPRPLHPAPDSAILPEC